MKIIPLTKGLSAIVADEDYEILITHSWYSVGGPGQEYAAYSGGKSKNLPQHVRMHRIIIDAPDDMEVDHINGNRLDNRRQNLRLATHAENGRNRGKGKGETHSRYKGVSWHVRDECYCAFIRVNSKLIHLGYFDSERDAALAYNKAAIKHFGEYANLNNLQEESDHVQE